MNPEAQLHVRKVLGTPQRLSKRIVFHFEFNPKSHRLKENDMPVRVK